MKSLVQKMKSLVWLLLVGLWLLPDNIQAQQTEVSFQTFYDELSPYGRWIIHPKYGDVWAPNVEGEFTPYLTNGYWTVTQYGNTWVSNYDWGWATFHYGRWYFDEFEGWVWIPDTVWAPAWVVWRNGGGYYGWAAMSPGINFSLSFNLFNSIPYNYWCFVPQQYVWRPYVYRYCAPRHRNVYIVNNTTYVSHCTINNVTYNYYTGPSHTEITHVTNRPVVIHNVEHGSRPGRTQVDRDKITIYKPTVNRAEIDRTKLKSFTRSENEISKDWYNSSKNQGDSNTGNNGDSHNNNGHGNGDQNAPGNSGEHNNAENSNGDKGKGKRDNMLNSDRTNTTHNWNSGNTFKRNESNNMDSRNFRLSESKKTTSNWSTDRSLSGGTRSYTPSRSNASGNSNKSFTPSRSNSSSGGNRSFTPSHSGSNNKSFTPSHSSGSSSNSNRNFTPSRTNSGSGGKTITPSRSSGSSGGHKPKR